MMRIIALLGLLAFFAAPAHAQDSILRNAITVSAEAEAKSAPDKVELSIGLSERSAKLDVARAQVDRQLKSLLAIAKEMDIAEKDLKTTYSAVQPEYSYTDNNRRQFDAYRVTHNITVTLHDLDQLAGFTDRVLNAGIDEIHNTQFGLADEEALTQEALKKAVGKAWGKANALAEAAGVKLGAVLSISEGTNVTPPITYRRRGAMTMEAASANGGASAPPAGEISVQATVTLIYELAK